MRSARWLAPVLALAVLAPVRGRAQTPPPWIPPPPVEAAVRRAVATEWRTDAAAVRLEWGAPSAPVLGSGAEVRLGGTGTGGWWTVTLRGEGGRGVPVRVRAGVEQAVPVAARELPRDWALEPADIEVRPVVRWGAPGPPAAGVEAGWTTRRVVPEGEPLEEPAVVPPLLVRTGDPVRVVVRRGSVELVVQGTAVGGGRRGDAVTVRVGTGWRIDGTVTGPGTVGAGSAEETRR